MKKITYHCSHCDSENLVWRAYVSWHDDLQSFSVSVVDNEAYCEDCGLECDPITKQTEERDDGTL